MSKCLICYQHFVETVTFKTLFNPQVICDECYLKFAVIKNGCPFCSHPVGYNCCNQMLVNKSLFLVNPFIKQLFYEIKVYGMQEKLLIFKPFIKQVISKYFQGFSVVPVPLSKTTLKRRTFNQCIILANYTNLKVENCLLRIDDSVQSQKSYLQRVINPPIFELKYLPKNKHLVIIDDIYTTGATFRAIAKLFPKEYKIYFLTMQRSVMKP